jgi:2-oxo-4-hydroxy-4-carboxy--5-ureidoimidazoline (OHCU) decarboxylase
MSKQEAAQDRDIAMARLAAARTWLAAGLESLDAALAHFVDPDEDADGEERLGSIEDALEAAGQAAAALELAKESISEDFDWEMGEPEIDEEEDEDRDEK